MNEDTVSMKEFLELKARVVYLESLVKTLEKEVNALGDLALVQDQVDVHMHGPPVSLQRYGAK